MPEEASCQIFSYDAEGRLAVITKAKKGSSEKGVRTIYLDRAKKGSELFILTEEEKVPGALIRGATTAQTVRAEEGGVRNRC
jgi:hypothetical protein